MAKNIEREFKWQAKSQRDLVHFERVLHQKSSFSAPQELRLRDYYLDDARGQLARKKIALRIRRCGTHFEATLKTKSALQNGLAVRREITLNLPNVCSVKQALRVLAARGTWQGVDVSQLQVRFCIDNRRRLYTLHYAGCVCEAALDNYLTRAAKHQWRRREIELELKKGRVRTFSKLVQLLSAQSSLCAAQLSKVAGAEAWLQSKVRLN